MAILSIAEKEECHKHPILSGIKLVNEWKWDSLSKSECVSLASDNKIAYFFDNPYTISRGTAGKMFF
jgi:hypothetical protein